MYDFDEGRAAAGTAGDGGRPPHPALTLLELPRWAGEYGAARALSLAPADRHLGRGRPVLVLPGFAANDLMTGRLRAHLRRRGWRVHGWGLGRNIGLTDHLVDGLTARFEQVAAQHDEPVSLVGWSFGGLLARRLAHEHPGRVRQVVCLGSPWRAEGERTRATALFERSRVRHGVSDRARDIVDALRAPLPVPLTAVWSRTDGITSWHGCRVDERTAPPPAENVEVPSSHVGLVAGPLPLAVVTDRLAQDPADWRPFSWSRLLPAPLPAVAGTVTRLVGAAG